MKLNPNNLFFKNMDEQYYKLLLIVIQKYELGEVIITGQDLQDTMNSVGGSMPCILMHDKATGLHIKVVTEEEGHRLAKEHGGLPT